MWRPPRGGGGGAKIFRPHSHAATHPYTAACPTREGTPSPMCGGPSLLRVGPPHVEGTQTARLYAKIWVLLSQAEPLLCCWERERPCRKASVARQAAACGQSSARLAPVCQIEPWFARYSPWRARKIEPWFARQACTMALWFARWSLVWNIEPWLATGPPFHKRPPPLTPKWPKRVKKGPKGPKMAPKRGLDATWALGTHQF